MRKTLNKIGNLLFWILLFLIMIEALNATVSKFKGNKVPSVFGLRALTVLSGSMRPVLQPGDIIVIKNSDASTLKNGDIVTMMVGNELVTHRIVSINSKGVTTRGDANNVNDGITSFSNIVGTYCFRIPYAGYAAQFLRGPIGIALIIGIFVYLVSFEVINNWSRKMHSKKDIKPN